LQKTLGVPPDREVNYIADDIDKNKAKRDPKNIIAHDFIITFFAEITKAQPQQSWDLRQNY